MICTFFGHKDAPNAISSKLKNTIIALVENEGVATFYVGNQGNFDYMVKQILEELNLNYFIVLAYLPSKKDEFNTFDFSKTIYPEGLESVPQRFAICRRNQWLIKNSDFVVTYVTRSFGGAATFKEQAIKAGKKVFELS